MENGLIEQEELNFLLYDWLNIEDFLIDNNSEIIERPLMLFLIYHTNWQESIFYLILKNQIKLNLILKTAKLKFFKKLARL